MLRWFETRIDPFQPPPPRDAPPRVLAFVWHFVAQARFWILALFVLAALKPILEALLFVYLGRAVDVMSMPSTPGTQAAIDPLFYQIPLLLLLSILCGTLLHIVSNLTMAMFAPLVREQNHHRVIRRPLSYFQGELSGRIASHVFETGGTLWRSLTNLAGSLWFTVIFLVSTGVILATLYWAFLIPLAVWLAGYAAILWIVMPRLGHASAANSEDYSQLRGRFVDTYVNIQTVKLYGGTEREDGFVRGAIVRMMATFARLMRLYTLQNVAVMLLDALLIGTVFLLALRLWSQGTVPVGGIVVATGLAIRLHAVSSAIIGGVSGLAQNLGTIQNAMQTIAPANPEPPPRPASGVPVQAGSVRFDDVVFGYQGGERVLDGLSFEVPARGSLGIVGLSGAGKSTILNLLAGLYAPQSGVIRIDDRDIGSLAESELWDALSVVMQDPQLFNRSVRNNVGFGLADADDAQIREALVKASALDFVETAVDGDGNRGLDALIGERGVRLSGGQRQRLGIARALLKDAPILVFDEPTSALDSETETAIQKTLSQLLGQRTIVVIAHRISTVAAMDRILVLDRGKIAEVGTHAELVARGGLYHGFWKLQTQRTSDRETLVTEA